MSLCFFSGLEFVPTTPAERAAGKVGRVYRADLGNGYAYEVTGSDGEYVFVQQQGGAFDGKTFRWHVSSLNGMKCERF